MSVESSVDRALLLDDFGEPCDWTVGVVTTSAVLVLFDHGTVPQGLQDGGLLNRRGTITLPDESVPAGAGDESDRLVLRGVTYRPKSVRPDGTGFTVVTLEEVL